MTKRILLTLALAFIASGLTAQVEVPPGSLLADLGTCDATREGLIRKVTNGDATNDCNPTGTGDDTVLCSCIETSPATYAWSAIGLSSGDTTLAGGSTTEVQYNNATALGGISQMTYDGTNLTLAPTAGDNVVAEEIIGEFYNNSGATIFRCAAVYISGFNVPADLPEISVADADDAAKMPAVGLLYADLATATAGFVVEFGDPQDLDTTTGEVWVAGAPVYVNTSGTSTSADCGDTLTETKPTGATELIQKIGTVMRVNASNGEIEVSGAGRSNDVPNAITIGTSDTINTDTVTLDNDWSDAQVSDTLTASEIVADTIDATTDFLGTLCGTGEYLVDDGASWSCTTVVSAFSPNTDPGVDHPSLSGGDGIAEAAGVISTASGEDNFLVDGGVTSLTCGATNLGRMQVMDDGTIEWCDGATTSVLRIASADSVSSAHHTLFAPNATAATDHTNFNADVDERIGAVVGDNAADLEMLVSTGASTAVWTPAPAGGTDGCSAAGDKPIWTASTRLWSCGTDGGGAPGADSIGTSELDDVANTPLAGNFVIVEVGAAAFDYIVPNAGTSIAADLEEEANIGTTVITGNAADDQSLIGSAASAATWSALPAGGTDGCSAAGDKPIYTASTNSWGCGTDTGAAGGDSITVDSVASEDGNFLDGDEINFDHATGPSPDDITATFDRSSTIAANPAIAANEVRFSIGGMIWEGNTADTIEVSLAAQDPIGGNDIAVVLPSVGGDMLVFITGASIDEPSDDPPFAVDQIVLSDGGAGAGGIMAEGATADAFESILRFTDPTADRDYTLPDAGGNVVIDSATQTLTNKTYDAGGTGNVHAHENGTAPVVDVDGEISIDETDDQIVFQSAASDFAISPKRCSTAVIENLASTDDNFGIGMFADAVTITDVGVHCDGTCATTLADIDLSDRGGTAMTHGAPTVSVTTGNTTFTTVTAANLLAAGEGLEFSVANTPTNDGLDTYSITYCYTVDRQ